MAGSTIKIFLGQSLATQYADLKSAGVLKKKASDNYPDKEERYTFLTADFTVRKKNGVVTQIQMDCAKTPPLA